MIAFALPLSPPCEADREKGEREGGRESECGGKSRGEMLHGCLILRPPFTRPLSLCMFLPVFPLDFDWSARGEWREERERARERERKGERAPQKNIIAKLDH